MAAMASDSADDTDAALVGRSRERARLRESLTAALAGRGSLVLIGGRTYTAGKDDYAAVHALQDRYKLVPLSAWGKPYTPPDNVPLKPGVDTKTPVPAQTLAMTPEAFFSRLNALMVNNPPEPADPATMASSVRRRECPTVSA